MGNVRDYAEGFDVEKLRSALDWVNARGLGAEIFEEKIIDGERVRLCLDKDGRRLFGFVLNRNEQIEVKEGDACTVAGIPAHIHSVDERGYCFSTGVK